MARTPKALHSKAGVRGHAAYQGNIGGNAIWLPQRGLDNRPTCMAVFVLHERSARGIRAFVKNPVGVLDPMRRD